MTGLLWELLDPLLKALRPPAAPARPERASAQRRAQEQARPKPPLRKLRSEPAVDQSLFNAGARPASEGTPGGSRPTAPTMTHVSTPPSPPSAMRARVGVPSSNARSFAPAEPMQARYDAVVRLMLEKHGVRVRKWRSNMSGIAWYVEYRDGTRNRLIESPRPRGPMSIAVFLHEIGHHAIGFDVYKPRCLEEYHAWRWALEAMSEHGLNITDQVRLRVHRSLHYAVQKAKRRGIKQIPVELVPYIEKPPPRRAARRTGGGEVVTPRADRASTRTWSDGTRG